MMTKLPDPLSLHENVIKTSEMSWYSTSPWYTYTYDTGEASVTPWLSGIRNRYVQTNGESVRKLYPADYWYKSTV